MITPLVASVIEILIAAVTQWRWIAVGDRAIPVGLDYAAVFAVADRIGVAMDRSRLWVLRQLESAIVGRVADEARRSADSMHRVTEIGP